MLKPGDVVDVIVEKPAAGGEMLARVDGQVLFVAGAIPGERVRVRVGRVAKGLARGAVETVVEASADRREGLPDPLCGGCVYSHIAYSRQLAIKSQVIADAFARIAKMPLRDAVVVAGSPEEGYRMRARLHVRGGRIGFFREGTHEVCGVRETRQLLPATCDALDRLEAAIRSLGGASLREIELSENVSASERVVSFDSSEPLGSQVADALYSIDGISRGPYVTDVLEIDGHRLSLRRHVLAFFQGNRHLLRAFVGHVMQHVPAKSRVADLYAGAGLFAVAAAVTRGASVVAVEGDRYAAEDLSTNAAVSRGGIEARRGDVESFAAPAGAFDVVIVDPPRTGMTRPALDRVLRLKTGTLIYVSCDVATLARDARHIVDAGYTLAAADAFDLFPNTPHVESVIVFRRN